MIIIKTEEDIKEIKEACRIWNEAKEYTLDLLNKNSDRSLIELDNLINKFIVSKGGTSTFYKMYGFPKHICMSVNDTIIHGIPDDYRLKETDKITFDMGVTYHNHVCDAAFIWLGKNVSEEQRDIANVAIESLEEAMKVIKPGGHVGDITFAIESYVSSKGYYLLEGFTGHGCGNKLHEDPIVPNEGIPAGVGALLKPGMVICIEPMLLAGSYKYTMHEQWDVKAINHNPTAHVEGMVLITKDGFERLA